MSGPRVSVLMYHRVAEAREAVEGDYALPTGLFDAQVQLLAQPGRAVIPLRALETRELPHRGIVLTFDDGCDTDASVVAPLLGRLGLPAAFFVNPARVGQAGRVTWAELRRIADRGFEVGSHGIDHALFGGLSSAELDRQLVESRRWLEGELGRPVTALSLPGGSGGERERRAAEAAGYRIVLGSRPGLLEGGDLSGTLPRFPIRRGHGLAGFIALIDQHPLFVMEQRLRYRVSRSVRSLLGESLYGRVRGRWVDRAALRRDAGLSGGP